MKTSVQIKPVLLGGLPIAISVIEALRIPELLEQHIPQGAREKIPASQSLNVMLCNVIMERYPLYKVAEWSKNRMPQGIVSHLNDDRIGRALDRLFESDRSALLTAIVLEAIRTYELDTSRVHNDSTSIKLFGEYPSVHPDAAIPLRGHSKDHRPDLKQVLFDLSVLGDEAIPIYFKVLDGNITDDKTHLTNWMSLRGLLGKSDFIYVADCKLCVRESMEFIDSQGGLFVTVMPRTRSEDKNFKDWLQNNTPCWNQIKEVPGKNKNDLPSIWWLFECPYLSKEGFRIVWVKSSNKQKVDEQTRTDAIEDTINEFELLRKKTHRNRKKLSDAVQDILRRKKTENYFHWKIVVETVESLKQSHMGRPTAKTTYKKITKEKYALNFTHNQEHIRYEAKCDGFFPLITNLKTPCLEVLDIYKFQPRLEKRHQQIKSVYHIAPVFLQNNRRIEALLFLYFLGLLVTSLIERSVRLAMKKKSLSSIPIYPEERECRRPTADKILELYRDIRLQSVIQDGKQLALIPDQLNPVQKTVLDILEIDQNKFFTPTTF